jgi:hypothetical protein
MLVIMEGTGLLFGKLVGIDMHRAERTLEGERLGDGFQSQIAGYFSPITKIRNVPGCCLNPENEAEKSAAGR